MLKPESRHAGIIRLMAEPEDLRELRRQAEMIEREREKANRRFFDDMEKSRLRRKIRDAGETPCR